MDKSDGNESQEISTESSRRQQTRNAKSYESFQKDVAKCHESFDKKMQVVIIVFILTKIVIGANYYR